MTGTPAVKPLLFLDVDGVVNPFDADLSHPDVHRKTLVYPSAILDRWRRSTVVLDRRHPELLRRLGEDLDICWGTAWEHDANPGLREILGFPEDLPVVDFGRRQGVPWNNAQLHWKTPILAAYAAGRPFCWIDDESGPADAAWLRGQGRNALVVTTDPAHGLTEHHVHEVLHWAGMLQRSAA